MYLLFVLLQFLVALESLDSTIGIKKIQHEFQTVAVHVHVEPVLGEHEQDGGGAQGQGGVGWGILQLHEELTDLKQESVEAVVES